MGAQVTHSGPCPLFRNELHERPLSAMTKAHASGRVCELKIATGEALHLASPNTA